MAKDSALLPYTLPPPIKGWNTRDALANFPALAAQTLQNWIPRSSSLEMRGGAFDWKTAFASAVETLMPYNPATGSRKLFAATSAGIYDATASGAVGAVVSAATNARWSYANFATSAGQFLVMVNGVDSYRYYNGSAWTTVATFVYGGGTVNTTKFIGLAVCQSRLFFVPKDELAFYYVNAVGSLTGTVLRFPCDQLFPAGGQIQAVTTWTVDGGTGSQDYTVILTSEGEVAIFAGGDPSDAANWFLKGVYTIGRPVGRRCFAKFGGDLLVLTERGLYPLSQSLLMGQLKRSVALTDTIFGTIGTMARQYFNTFGWQILTAPSQGLLLVLVPSSPKCIYAMDLVSKGWCELTEWDFTCMESLQGEIYAGRATSVAKAFSGYTDFGASIRAVWFSSPNYFQTRGINKVPSMIRPTFRSNGVFTETYGLSTDFRPNFTKYTIQSAASGNAKWGTSKWGQAKWGQTQVMRQAWRTLSAYPGFNMALYLEVASNTARVDLYSVDFLAQPGGFM